MMNVFRLPSAMLFAAALCPAQDYVDQVVERARKEFDVPGIAVAIVKDDTTEHGGATLKRVYREGNTIRLQPRNPEMQPLLVAADQVEIQGKVVKLVRDL